MTWSPPARKDCPVCHGRGFTTIYTDPQLRKNPGMRPAEEIHLPCTFCEPPEEETTP